MKKFIFLPICILSALFFLFSETTAQEKVWVYAKGADLKADKTASSETIARLSEGAELNVISLKKRWYNVSTDSGENGWIYRGKILKSPPGQEEEEDDDAGLLEELSDTGILLAAADTSRSIRGKSAETLVYELEAEAGEKYIRALNTVLSFYASDEDIELFLKQGRIGEYE